MSEPMTPDEIAAITERYHLALNAKPGKGPIPAYGIAAITDSVCDVPQLLAEIARLTRWKAEAWPVMEGMQELGKALGLPLGSRITGPAAVDAAGRLLDEVDDLRGALALSRALLSRTRGDLGSYATTSPSFQALLGRIRAGLNPQTAPADPRLPAVTTAAPDGDTETGDGLRAAQDEVIRFTSDAADGVLMPPESLSDRLRADAALWRLAVTESARGRTEAEVKAEALREAAAQMPTGCGETWGDPNTNTVQQRREAVYRRRWLRERADHIEAEASA